ncbi:hypothetical protein AB0O95_01330 [Rhodoglobus sp. NPDC076762]
MTSSTASRVPSGVMLILVATAIAGIAGYLVTFVVYRQIGAAPYALFAVFWAAIYLVIGGLSGIQQEITRATTLVEPRADRQASKARSFAVVLSCIVALSIVASAPLWAEAVFAANSWNLVWPLAVGAASYVLVATLSGSLYGAAQWRSVALMTGADGILRLILLSIALLFTQDIVVLAWTVALPFPLVLLLLWPAIRGGFVGRTALDVGHRALSWNVARTVLASASTAVLVSGFPLLLATTAVGENQAFVGELIFTITLTRAPLIVTIMSLQSFLVVRFRDGQSSWLNLFIRVQGSILLGGVTLAGLGWWLGPDVFELVSGRPTLVGGELIATLVMSSALVAMLSVTAPAVLARGQHMVYSLGWLAAALTTVIVMLLPGELVTRVSLALVLGPLAGLIVHSLWIATANRNRRSISF